MANEALIVWGGWAGHTPRESAEVFRSFLERKGYQVAMADTLDVYLDQARMTAWSLIVPIWTMGEITKEQWGGLNRAIQAGTGLAGFHGGIIDAFRDNTDYQWMTGGQWVAHPGGCIDSYRVEIADGNHPITANVDGFTLADTEQYYVHVDPANHTLCTTEFGGEHGPADLYESGTVMPYAWTKRWGKGRVFVACWGHTYKDFDVPQARQIVERGMLWASR